MEVEISQEQEYLNISLGFENALIILEHFQHFSDSFSVYEYA